MYILPAESKRGDTPVLNPPTEPSSEEFERVATEAPTGALALCAIAVAIVVTIWLAFYFFAFLPRGPLQ